MIFLVRSYQEDGGLPSMKKPVHSENSSKPANTETDESGESVLGAWFEFTITLIVLNWVFVRFEFFTSEWVSIHPHEWPSLVAILFYSFAQPGVGAIVVNLGLIFVVSSYLSMKKVPVDNYMGTMILSALMGGLAIWLFESSYHYYVGLSNIGFGLLGYAVLVATRNKKKRYTVAGILIISILAINYNISGAHITEIGHVGGLVGGLPAGSILEKPKKDVSQNQIEQSENEKNTGH